MKTKEEKHLLFQNNILQNKPSSMSLRLKSAFFGSGSRSSSKSSTSGTALTLSISKEHQWNAPHSMWLKHFTWARSFWHTNEIDSLQMVFWYFLLSLSSFKHQCLLTWINGANAFFSCTVIHATLFILLFICVAASIILPCLFKRFSFLILFFLCRNAMFAFSLGLFPQSNFKLYINRH